MKREIPLSNLEGFLKGFNERHETRPVTPELLDGTTPMTEAEGLPLIGLDLDRQPSGSLDVEILMGDEAPDGKRYLAHTVSDVERVVVEMEKGNRETRLLFEDGEGGRATLELD
jgi:hypothetical protein